MNPFLIKQGLSLATAARKELKRRQNERERADFDQLLASASEIPGLRNYLNRIDDNELKELELNAANRRRISRDAAGPITQAAHVRLDNAKRRLGLEKLAVDAFDFDKAKERLGGAVSDAVSDVDDATKKSRKKFFKRVKPLRKKAAKRAAKLEKVAGKARTQAEKKARKAQKKAQARVERKRRGAGGGVVATVVALLAAIAGAVYWFFLRKKEQPVAAKAPRVEEYAGDREQKSTLVYSSVTEGAPVETEVGEGTATPPMEAPAAPVKEKKAGELAEDPAERDEELLGSIDEQLEAHRRSEDAVAQASAGADEASERLRNETARAEAEFEAKRNQ